jgi:hypothetical protein
MQHYFYVSHFRIPAERELNWLCKSVFMHAWDNSSTAERILIKYDIGEFHLNLSTYTTFG